jgi:hypothetical protein
MQAAQDMSVLVEVAGVVLAPPGQMDLVVVPLVELAAMDSNLV